ncbi:MAG: YlxR family protein [Chloroflexota bacterium]
MPRARRRSEARWATLSLVRRNRRVSSSSPSVEKRVPQRTCVGCRQVMPKHRLVRLARTADGGVVVDRSGKECGRGAYMCAEHSCWIEGIARGRLERALRVKLDSRTRESIEAYAAAYIAREVSA